ncbi:hypothetical protein MKX08_000138 [Trichoderma sp. CBMAI-0020]|nr:hypothetical protein MKX08_000138 [Trichoderma sp. CBMAI-0020]
MERMNPCMNPNIPPIRIELSDIPCDDSHPHYANGVAVVKAYWQQATNMTLDDQAEYKTLIEQQQFLKQRAALLAPHQHGVFKSCQISPTQVECIYKSLKIENLETDYRAYNPNPASDKKRKATKQLQPSKAQRSTNSSQLNASPALGNTSPVTQGDLERFEAHLKEYMDDHVKEVRESMCRARTEQRGMIRNVTELIIDKLSQLEKDQTEYLNAMEVKIGRMAADRVNGEKN